MGNYILAKPGTTITLTLTLMDNTTPANNPVINDDCEVYIRRLSDDKWWDFTNSEWDTVAFGALVADNKQALTDKGDGSYEYDWDQAAADASAERKYEMYYKVTSAGTHQNMVSTEHWFFTNELTDDIAGATFDATTDSLEAIRDRGDSAWTTGGVAPTVDEINDKLVEEHGDAGWTTSTGVGANVVTITLTDGTDPINGVTCVVRNSAETTIVAYQTTNATGKVELQLDDATYKVRYGPSSGYTFSNPYTLTVSGATTQTFTCVAITIPASTDPTLCTCYIDLAYAVGANAGQLVGAGEGTVEIQNVWPAWSDTIGERVLSNEEETFSSNASGRVSFDAVRGAQLSLRIVRPGRVDPLDITVPDQATYYIALAGRDRR